MSRLITHQVVDKGEIKAIEYRKSDIDAPEELIQIFENGGRLWITEEEGRPIAIGGVVPVREGVGHFVFACVEDAFDRPFDLIHEMKRVIHACKRMYSLFRLQFMVSEGFDKRLQFADFLGFQVEGTHPKSGPNQETWISFGKVE